MTEYHYGYAVSIIQPSFSTSVTQCLLSNPKLFQYLTLARDQPASDKNRYSSFCLSTGSTLRLLHLHKQTVTGLCFINLFAPDFDGLWDP